jgi:hypothetical protein
MCSFLPWTVSRNVTKLCKWREQRVKEVWMHHNADVVCGDTNSQVRNFTIPMCRRTLIYILACRRVVYVVTVCFTSAALHHAPGVLLALCDSQEGSYHFPKQFQPVELGVGDASSFLWGTVWISRYYELQVVQNCLHSCLVRLLLVFPTILREFQFCTFMYFYILYIKLPGHLLCGYGVWWFLTYFPP